MTEEKFNMFFDFHCNLVYRFLYQSVWQSSDAENLLQDVAWIAFQNFASLRNASKMGNWLQLIACKCLKQYYKQIKQQVSLDVRAIDELIRDSLTIDIDRSAARIFLDKLDPVWRKIIILTLEYEFSSVELADMFGRNWTNAGCINYRVTRIAKTLANAVCEEVSNVNKPIRDAALEILRQNQYSWNRNIP